jgi:cytochrome c
VTRRLRRLLPALVAMGGCDGASVDTSVIRGGDTERGRAALARFECGVCHVIPGVRGPQAHVGPPLDHFRQRVYLAGKFPNTPEVLVRWLIDPPSLALETAMPAMGVTEAEARDMAAYLYGLE